MAVHLRSVMPFGGMQPAIRVRLVAAGLALMRYQRPQEIRRP